MCRYLSDEKTNILRKSFGSIHRTFPFSAIRKRDHGKIPKDSSASPEKWSGQPKTPDGTIFPVFRRATLDCEELLRLLANSRILNPD